MATKKRSKKQLSLKLGLKDERIPKLFGILCLFLAVYLFIAFTSYLFTWQEDFDLVDKLTFGELMSGDREMSNWLGRLGASISHMFFYWGFGLPSYIFVAFLTTIGIGTIKQLPFTQNVRLFWNSFLVLLFLSIVLEFIFSGSLFPWGGAFGEGVINWLTKFVGNIGTIALLLFILLGVITWIFNPNFNNVTVKGTLNNIKYFYNDLISGRYFKKRKPKVVLPTLKSGHFNSNKKSAEGAATMEKMEAPQNPELSEVVDGQLAFELENNKDKQKPKSLKKGEAELEINEPIPSAVPPPTSIPPSTPSIDNPMKPVDKMHIEVDNTNHGEPYDPTLDLASYEHPVLALLEDYDEFKVEIDRAELEANKDQIIETLLNYKIEIIKIKATIGPTVTLYEIVPAPGVRISRIKNLEDDIALNLAALGIRIIAPIPGKGTIGIEVPNKKQQVVSLKEVLFSEKFKRAKMDLPIALGKTISNEVFVADLAKMPHLLVAGATGQGKSVGINVILMSLIYKKHPSQIKFVLIDPKKVELFPYAQLENHFLAYLPGLDDPIVTDTNKVVHTLNSLIIEMETRYDLLKQAKSRNIREYNEKFVSRRLNPEKGHHFMPFIVLVIDEFADLIMTAGKEVELPIGRLAQLSRAVGIHLIIATQRPSVNIITGVIKANFPARMAFRVTAKVDSRTIIDTGGAERLIGRGDMLLSFGSDLVRLQCAFIDTPEVEKVISYIGDQQGYPVPYFLPEFHGDDEVHAKSGLKFSDLDSMFEDAARLVVSNQHGSTSMIQRRLKLGYNRAGRIMDQMEAFGIVGPSDGSKAREVLVFGEVELERYLEDIKTRK